MISIAVISIPSSTNKRTVLVCAKTVRGRAVIVQSTWPAKKTYGRKKRQNQKPTAKQTSPKDSWGQNEKNHTKTKTIQTLEKEIITFSAETPKT